MMTPSFLYIVVTFFRYFCKYTSYLNASLICSILMFRVSFILFMERQYGIVQFLGMTKREIISCKYWAEN